MHARMWTFQVRPGRIDEMIRISREAILPAARDQEGFRGVLLLTDRDAGKSIVVTLWETEADLVAGETGGYARGQIAKIVDLVTGRPDPEHYEVSLRA